MLAIVALAVVAAVQVECAPSQFWPGFPHAPVFSHSHTTSFKKPAFSHSHHYKSFSRKPQRWEPPRDPVETQQAYEDFIDTWLKQARLTLNPSNRARTRPARPTPAPEPEPIVPEPQAKAAETIQEADVVVDVPAEEVVVDEVLAADYPLDEELPVIDEVILEPAVVEPEVVYEPEPPVTESQVVIEPEPAVAEPELVYETDLAYDTEPLNYEIDPALYDYDLLQEPQVADVRTQAASEPKPQVIADTNVQPVAVEADYVDYDAAAPLAAEPKQEQPAVAAEVEEPVPTLVEQDLDYALDATPERLPEPAAETPSAKSNVDPFPQMPIFEYLFEAFSPTFDEPFFDSRVEPTVKELVEEPIMEPVEEPIVEPPQEPVVELVQEPITEPIVEHIAEPTAEPFVEPVTERFIEIIQEPVEEIVEEVIVEPTEATLPVEPVEPITEIPVEKPKEEEPVSERPSGRVSSRGRSFSSGSRSRSRPVITPIPAVRRRDPVKLHDFPTSVFKPRAPAAPVAPRRPAPVPAPRPRPRPSSTFRHQPAAAPRGNHQLPTHHELFGTPHDYTLEYFPTGGQSHYYVSTSIGGSRF